MIWKVLYDFTKPNWQTFGHVLFVEAERACEAESAGLKAAAAYEGDVTITRLDVTPATEAQRERFNQRVEAMARWQANVTNGTPNPRRLL